VKTEKEALEFIYKPLDKTYVFEEPYHGIDLRRVDFLIDHSNVHINQHRFYSTENPYFRSTRHNWTTRREDEYLEVQQACIDEAVRVVKGVTNE